MSTAFRKYCIDTKNVESHNLTFKCDLKVFLENVEKTLGATENVNG